ncbi:MAG: type II secretion system GspH family protein, partial [Pyrinomonadaceae bacterium]|nr:type II secretion system GspH family protein [Pyrinomonadaceae bacterium]
MERYRKQQNADTRLRGDTVKAVRVPGRRVTLSAVRSPELSAMPKQSGFTLIELVMTITIMTILTLGVMPLVKVSVKRQREQQLRDALRQMRIAIDEFHRDTVGMICTGNVGITGQQQQQQQAIPIDPRSRVAISDCTIFGVDNPDRYPPDLETLVTGVNVTPRGGNMGGRGDRNVNATDVGNPELSTKKKVYLRAVPIDPMTGKAEWDLRSCYDASDAGSWGGE